jgi:hypothetical protein
MPSLKRHLEFDEKRLKKNGVIFADTDGTTVHRRMDRNAYRYGPDHRELDKWHTPDAIRDMVDNIVGSIGMDSSRGTDYVRIAYGHRCLDSVASGTKRECCCRYADLDDGDWRSIYTHAYKLFRRYHYHKKVYQPRRL